jgi:hypothetical protein
VRCVLDWGHQRMGRCHFRGQGRSLRQDKVNAMLNQNTVSEATRLTRAGQLVEATALLSRTHQSCRSEGGTTAGEFLKPIMWRIIRSTPDARPGQPRTKKRKCGIQPAHQSLLTDVFASRLLLCTIHQCMNFTMSSRGETGNRALCA